MNPADAPRSTLAPTPPMGWNSWNMFGPRVSAEAVCAIADAFINLGLQDLGYQYLVIDDCWTVRGQRDAHGDLIPDPERFPDGVKPVADYVHSKGLKLGIYSDAAEMTCAGYPGSFGYEEQDAALWASWGIDYLKYDYCHAPSDQPTAIERYSRMGRALQNCGREILFSICEWGGRSPHLWGRQVGGQLWRSTGDIIDSWVNVLHGTWWGLGIDAAIDIAASIADYGGPGGWNDMDMLVVGLKGKGHVPGAGANFNEYQTHVSMWSMWCSPLMIGCDPRSMDAETTSLLTNPEVLAVNQDPLGKPAKRVKQTGPLEVWRKPLASGGVAVALLNRGSTGAEISFTAGELGLLDHTRGTLRDLWKREDVAEFSPAYGCMVQPHQTVLLRLVP